MFYGKYEHTLDKKGRLIIPARFRELLTEHYVEKLFITTGLDGCLFIFTEEEWKVHDQKFRAISFTKSEGRKFNRLYFSGATDVTWDKQGRILIPQYLKEFADIKKEIVLIGVSNRMEVWSKDRWRAFYQSSKESYEQTAEGVLQ